MSIAYLSAAFSGTNKFHRNSGHVLLVRQYILISFSHGLQINACCYNSDGLVKMFDIVL